MLLVFKLKHDSFEIAKLSFYFNFVLVVYQVKYIVKYLVKLFKWGWFDIQIVKTRCFIDSLAQWAPLRNINYILIAFSNTHWNLYGIHRIYIIQMCNYSDINHSFLFYLLTQVTFNWLISKIVVLKWMFYGHAKIF